MKMLTTILSIVQTTAPLIALLTALARVAPSIAIATKARRRPRNPSHRTLRVKEVECKPPWDGITWPEDWEKEDTRKRFRATEMRQIKTFFFSSLTLFAVYLVIFILDYWDILYGSGYGAAAGAAVFAFFAIVYAVYWNRIRGDRGLKETLYGSSSQLAIVGDIADIQQYCLGVLHEIGCKIVKCAPYDGDQNDDGPVASLVGATGFWPPRWMSVSSLQLVAFRGERVEVSIYPLDKNFYKLIVTSDNVDPGVDEGRWSNRRNVRKFVEAWAFFPDCIVLGDAA